jgi:hypothetical protein
VPVVSSLRRRGKIIVGAGFSDASTALVRECYQYIDLSSAFLTDDMFAFMLFKPDGIIFNWLAMEVVPSKEASPSQARLMAEWQLRHIVLTTKGALPTEEKFYPINFAAEGSLDLSTRIQYVEQIRANFPDRFVAADPNGRSYQIAVNAANWSSIDRCINALLPTLKGKLSPGGLYSDANCTATYHYNDSTRVYELASITE